MNCVWKYQFSVSDAVAFELPKGAVVLSVDMQRDTPCLWVLVDPHQPTETRRFLVFGTGHPITGRDLLRHVGTFQQDERFVWHVFEPMVAPSRFVALPHPAEPI